MKRFSISTVLWSLLLLFVYSCEDLGVQPVTEETATPLNISNTESDMALVKNANGNKITLYLYYKNIVKKEKAEEVKKIEEIEKVEEVEKIEVNRHQATLNFDNHDPQIVRIESKEKMINLKNFRAEYNLLTNIPELALYEGIKRIEIAHNKLKELPDLRKRKISTIKLLDISYNDFKKNALANNKKPITSKDLINLNLQSGATLNLTKTKIDCDVIKKFIEYNLKYNLEIIVISDCK